MFKINRTIYNYVQPRIINEDNNKYFLEFILCLKYLQIPTIKFQQGNNKFIFQTEQLTRSDWKNKINDISKVSIILDYSEYNKKLLLDTNNRAIIIICPIFFTHEMRFNNVQKDFDFVFIGGLNERRNKIIDSLKNKGFSVLIINDIFDFDQKYQKIMKAKCLINIHFADDYKVFEFARCAIPCFNNIKIISENCEGLEYEKNNPINRFIIDRIIFCNYEDIVEVAIKNLNNQFININYDQLQIISENEKFRINSELKRYY